MNQLAERARRMLEVLRGFEVRQSVCLAGIEASVRGSGEWRPFENGAEWGRDQASEWTDFRFSVTIPEGFMGKAVLRVRTGREGWEGINPQMLVWVNGRVEQAFDTRHQALVLQGRSEPGARFDIGIEGFANAIDVHTARLHPIPPRLFVSLDDVCEDVEQLVYDLNVPWQGMMLEEQDSRDREWTARTLSDALNLLDLRNPHSAAFHESVAEARRFLRENYYDAMKARTPEAYADCVGHTHIDVAWLWDLEQTRHKAARSFSTMLKLMEAYPDFKFMSSQPQLYAFVKEDHPELFERIKAAVARGQWEPEGGMWVEADCNLAGGESLIRQFLYGNEFFETEFGRRSRILWLPDVFGYSAALPQILKKCGIDYFLTSKLSWSEFNRSPYDTFLWKGIDGSEVLTHFTPAREYNRAGGNEADLPWYTTYNAMLDPTHIKGGWQRFQQKGLDNHYLVAYGYGDGGGGSTDWMIENARRMAHPVAGLPAVRQTFPSEFFRELDARVSGDARLPKWTGELYLEYHRGTYTAMARNKRSNRKLELELREVELWRERARRDCGLPYPNDVLRRVWRSALTLQFHDILPGSSIGKVYEDSAKIYAELFETLAALKAEALNALGEGLRGDLLLYNSLARERDDVVWFDAPEGVTALRDERGGEFPVQFVDGRACAFVRGLMPMGATPVWFVRGEPSRQRLGATAEGFETPFFRGRFDGAGRLSSLVDKRRGRELAKPGEALNRIVCYENYPHNYDAWDINIYYGEHAWEVDDLVSSEVICDGPVLAKVRNVYRWNRSTIRQDVVLYHDLARVDFETEVDWREAHYMLKAHFPVDVFYDEATYDIQYGNVRRATHKNTSWDVARFEVCAHKWADVSEGDYGFSLMNDCKYGHSVDERGVALTLLKSSTYPNPTADQETHRFTYAIAPHEGGWRQADVPGMAYRLNIPVTAAPGRGGEGTPAPFARVDRPNVIVESVKRGLREEVTVLRLYECYGQRTSVKLTLGERPGAVYSASMMEDKQERLEADDGAVALTLRPYEIVTLMIE